MCNDDYYLPKVTCGLSTLGSTLSTLLRPCVLHFADLLVQLWLTACRREQASPLVGPTDVLKSLMLASDQKIICAISCTKRLVHLLGLVLVHNKTLLLLRHCRTGEHVTFVVV